MITVTPTALGGVITAPPSKSHLHRILVCDRLSGVRREFEGLSEDLKATFDTLDIIFNGNNGVKNIDCNESGSTLRFLLCIACAVGGSFCFSGAKTLFNRPIEPLLRCLSAHGVTFEHSDNGILINGKLRSGVYEISADLSSQFLSGLMLALSTVEGESKIVLTTALSSAPYVTLTEKTLLSYGANITRVSDGYKIIGKKSLDKVALLPEGDWSNASFFLVAGVLNNGVTVSGLNPDSVQGDKKILEFLERAGAKISVESATVKVTPATKLSAFEAEVDDCIDLVPPLAVLGAFAVGKTVLRGVERLKYKESNRIETVIDMLLSFGITARYFNDSIIIYGLGATGLLPMGTRLSVNDHRILMSASIIASHADSKTRIDGENSVNKSYPDFFKDYVKLGGIIDEL